MGRRIDIELTSRREDGSWTWRAPGARQPRGTIVPGLVPETAKVGDQLRAEAEFELEGIVVTAVMPIKNGTGDQKGNDRIEVLGSGRDTSGVSVALAPGSKRRRDRDERGPGEGGRSARSRDDRGRARRERPEGPPATEDGGQRAPRSRSSTSDEGHSRRDRTRVTEGGRSARHGPQRNGRDQRRSAQTSTTHRNAALADLRPEQLPVAEQLLRGGIPAVRHAIDEQNERARSEGRAEVSPEPLLAMAEELLPKVNLATWKDRAVVVRDSGRDAPLREVRSVVAGASAVNLDDEGRELAAVLRKTLDERVTALREGWLQRITTALDSGRVADALRISGNPPEPSARVPAPLAVRLVEAAGTSMAP
ncbi:MAG TPA: hypothetical protein VEJ87_04610, partial [Acidimicrobiales bacterium]|nr:hypothetical protein [Acidimicrobiales bacterium]